MAQTLRTAFDQYDLVPLQNMLRDSDPGRLSTVSGHWTTVHQDVVQAAEELGQAVGHALQSWRGAAAESFADRGERLRTRLANTAEYARSASDAMGAAGTALKAAKAVMGTISVPSGWERGWKLTRDGFNRSDEEFRADLAKGVDRITALDRHYDSMSATEIAHQHAISTMEHLAPHYLEAAAHLEVPDSYAGYQDYPPPPPNPTPAGGIPVRPMPRLRTPDAAGPARADGHGSDGRAGGAGLPPTPSGSGGPGAAGPVSTGLDGWAPPAGGPVVVGAPDGGGAVPGGGAGGGPAGGGFTGLVGPAAGGGTATAGGPGGAWQTGAGTGRGGAQAAGAGRGGAAQGSARARAFTAGGTGLGRNRPGSAGGPGLPAGSTAKSGRKKDRKQRPDYLVEDQETWRGTEQQANPPVVE
ncbi:hypothetical protein ABT095_18645 [Kitasatospora sp. NPDC002227]|uniref:WXG100 family type VII secretion target n=1 Tax=Kitasatospora sp. NPDC002227 TaxID=3154773 RepID=UPI00332D7136